MVDYKNFPGLRTIVTTKFEPLTREEAEARRLINYGLGENQYYNQITSSEAGSSSVKNSESLKIILGNLEKRLGNKYKIEGVIEEGNCSINWSKKK